MTFRTCISSRVQVTIGLMLGVYITMASRSHFNLMLVDAGDAFKEPNVHYILNIVYQVGYMVVQVPSGIWLDGVNPVPVLGVIVLILAASSFISPFAFHAGLFYQSAVLAGINGLIGGCWWPSMGVMLSNWAPPAELSYMYSTIITGIPGGIILGTVIPGLIYRHRHSSDFQHSFFILAVACALWGFVWLYAFYGSPLKDPGVGEEELQYLSAHIKPKLKLPVPWKYIITSVPVWSMLLANYGSTVFYAVLLYYMPVYVKTVLKLNISHNGFISATPPLSQIVVIFITGYIAMVIQKKQWTTVTNIRKIFTCIGMLLPACILLVAPLAMQGHIFYIMIVLAFAASGSVFSGFRVTLMEMSPNFVAVITSMADVVGGIAMNSTHVILMLINEQNKTQQAWDSICLGLSGILIVCVLQFMFLSSSEVQVWNEVT